MAGYCTAGSGNMGTGDCPISFDEIVGAVAHPSGESYTYNQMLNFIATMQPLACSTDLTQRVQVLFPFVQQDPDNADRQTAESPFGNRVETREAIPGFTHTLWGDMCANRSAYTLFNKRHKQWRFIYFAKNGDLMAVKVQDPITGETRYRGFTLTELSISMYSPGNGTDPGMWTVSERLLSAEWYKQWAYFPSSIIDGLPSDIEPMTTIELENIVQDPVVTGTYVIRATAGCGSTDMGLTYPTLLAAANIRARNQAGAEIAITSSTRNAITGNSTIVLDTDDTDFVEGQPIVFDIDVLTGLGACFESEIITLPNA